MSQLIITINTSLVDADGEAHRIRKEVDLFADLTVPQQTAVTVLMTRIAAAIKARYGDETQIESVRYLES